MKFSISRCLFLAALALAVQNCQSIPEKINNRPPTILSEPETAAAHNDEEAYFDKLLSMTSEVEDQSRDIHDLFADESDEEIIKLSNYNPQDESGLQTITYHRESKYLENESEESLKNARLEIQKYKLLLANRKQELESLAAQAKEREAKLKIQIDQGNLKIKRLRQKISEK